MRRRIIRRVRVLLARLTVRWLRALYAWHVLPLVPGWGWERGTPIDRYYIAGFIQEHAGAVRGRVLEFGLPDYQEFFDPARIEQYDIIDVVQRNEHVTIIGDIQRVPQIADATYDCIVCTQVLLLVPDPRAAASELHRILKPGGLLLLTLPQVALTVPKGEFPADYWRFTEDSVRLLLAPFSEVRVTAHGNPIGIFCFASRIVVEDISPATLDWNDPRFSHHLNAYARK
jgi:SAM-dependent methyltransferase